MNLFERLPQEDVRKLWQYLEDFGGGSALPESRMDYFLRYWNIAKQPFFTAFGEKFIIKKPVSFEKTVADMEDEMESAIRYDNYKASCFRSNFIQKAEEIFPYYTDECYHLKSFVNDWEMLVENYYSGPAFTIPAAATVDERPLQINKNCKVSKMLGKIAKAIGMSEEFYEQFRLAHSQVLNQKMIRGDLCLSIHPLDYLTMSDNACDWSSCMSWMDDAGDYRMGTIEMMNSNYVVMAYIEAKEPMYLSYPNEADNTWNNKRWRQLYVVTPEMIIGNRQYPFHNDYVQGTVIKWLRELASTIDGFGPYELETCQISNHKTNTFGNVRAYIALDMDYMYNDLNTGPKLAYISPKYFTTSGELRLNLSGPAVCTGCGDVVEPRVIEAHNVRCNACNGYFYCSHCGEWSGGECYTDGEGRTYCEWCYHNELETCECCEDRFEESEMIHVYLQMPDCEEFDNWRYYVSLCKYCFREGLYEKTFGKAHIVFDYYGRERYAFDLMKIEDNALYYGSLDYQTADRLVQIINEADEEKRLELIRNL